MQKHANCPFCGGEAKLKEERIQEKEDIWNTYKFIECSCCGTRTRGLLSKIYWDDGYDCSTTEKHVYDEDVWKLWDKRM